jgi:hypothetical protein
MLEVQKCRGRDILEADLKRAAANERETIFSPKCHVL